MLSNFDFGNQIFDYFYVKTWNFVLKNQKSTLMTKFDLKKPKIVVQFYPLNRIFDYFYVKT